MGKLEFKGTQGNWQVIDTYDNYLPYTTETPQIIIWDGDEQASGPICDMGEIGDMNYAEALANAKLIAAAPEMLEALILALPQLKKYALLNIEAEHSFYRVVQSIEKASLD